MLKKIAVFGSSGAISQAIVQELLCYETVDKIYSFSRKPNPNPLEKVDHYHLDYEKEESFAHAAAALAEKGPLDLIFVGTGMLHAPGISPEKSLKDLSEEKFLRLYKANTVVPALVAKYFISYLPRTTKGVFAVLSARVGSISDNQLGGWYSYRCAKAALNMLIKNISIEIKQRHKHSIVVGLHPGTVDSDLSAPFKKNVPAARLFTPAFSAKHLLSVIQNLTPEETGKCFAWDGEEILP